MVCLRFIYVILESLPVRTLPTYLCICNFLMRLERHFRTETKPNRATNLTTFRQQIKSYFVSNKILYGQVKRN